MTPAVSLGQALMVARRHGVDFADAWPAAMTHAVAGLNPDELSEWLSALEDTRAAWAAAWERRPATRPERALLAVADDPERVAMADHECQRCGGEIPAERDRRAKWCSEKCRRVASYERERVAVAA